MKLRPFAILSLSAVAFIFTACKKEEAVVPPSAPPAPATATNTVINAPAPVVEAPASPAAATAAPAAKADHVLSPTEAKDHVDEQATVKGKVFGVHVTGKGDTFINVGAAYPNAPFTVVNFHGDEAIDTNILQALDGKTVAFTGKIKDHNGQAEIIIDKPDQFTADGAASTDAAPAAPAAPAPAATPPADATK